MLGETLGDVTGEVVLRRVLAAGPGATRTESTQRGAGTLLGVDFREMSTYESELRPDPNIQFGRPCVRGTRITVNDVLGLSAAGMAEDQILGDLPQLTRDDIRACLSTATTTPLACSCMGSLCRLRAAGH